MAWTYATLAAAIPNWLNNASTELANEVDTLIGLGEERILRDVDLRVFRESKTSNLTTSDKYLNLPSDCLVLRDLRFTTGDHLEEAALTWVNEYWPDTSSTSTPKYYAHYDHDTVVVAPTPDSNYAVQIHYTYKPTGLSSGNTTSWLGTNAHDALLYACLLEGAVFLEGAIPELVQLYEARYQRAIQGLSRLEGENRPGEFRIHEGA